MCEYARSLSLSLSCPQEKKHEHARARTHTQVRLEHRLEKQTKREFELLDLKYKARVAIEALCTHDFLREGKKSITREKKPGSSSAWALIHLDDVEKQHYATLIGRAHDPQLKVPHAFVSGLGTRLRVRVYWSHTGAHTHWRTDMRTHTQSIKMNGSWYTERTAMKTFFGDTAVIRGAKSVGVQSPAAAGGEAAAGEGLGLHGRHGTGGSRGRAEGAQGDGSEGDEMFESELARLEASHVPSMRAGAMPAAVEGEVEGEAADGIHEWGGKSVVDDACCNSEIGVDPGSWLVVKYSPSSKSMSVSARERKRGREGGGCEEGGQGERGQGEGEGGNGDGERQRETVTVRKLTCM